MLDHLRANGFLFTSSRVLERIGLVARVRARRKPSTRSRPDCPHPSGIHSRAYWRSSRVAPPPVRLAARLFGVTRTLAEAPPLSGFRAALPAANCASSRCACTACSWSTAWSGESAVSHPSGMLSFSKVDFSGLPKSSSTVRRGRDQAGGCACPADGGPFLFEGPVATEPKVRFSRSPRLGGFLRPASITAELGENRTYEEQSADGCIAPIVVAPCRLAVTRMRTFTQMRRYVIMYLCPAKSDLHRDDRRRNRHRSKPRDQTKS
jgi:hypothetical protein